MLSKVTDGWWIPKRGRAFSQLTFRDCSRLGLECGGVDKRTRFFVTRRTAVFFGVLLVRGGVELPETKVTVVKVRWGNSYEFETCRDLVIGCTYGE